MSEPTNAPRVWLRWALALALVGGTVAGSIAPALGQEDPAAAEPVDEQPVEETQPAAEAPQPEESQFQEAVEAALVAETTEAPVEEAAVEEAPPAEAPPVEEPPVEEPVADAPAQEAATEQTPYYDPVAGNANLDSPAAQEALGTTDGEAVPPDGGADEGSAGDDGSGGGQGEPATAGESSGETAPEETAQAEAEQPEEQVDEPLDFSEQVSATLGADVTLSDSSTPDGNEVDAGTTDVEADTEEVANEGGETTNEVEAGTSGTDRQVTGSRADRAADDEIQLTQQANSVSGGSNTNNSDITATESDSTAIADGSGGNSNAAAEANADVNDDGRVSVIEQRRAERQADKRAARRNGACATSAPSRPTPRSLARSSSSAFPTRSSRCGRRFSTSSRTEATGCASRSIARPRRRRLRRTASSPPRSLRSETGRLPRSDRAGCALGQRDDSRGRPAGAAFLCLAQARLLR